MARTSNECWKSRRTVYISLLQYRNIPVDGLSSLPAQLLMSSMLREKLPSVVELLNPSIVLHVCDQLAKRKKQSMTKMQMTSPIWGRGTLFMFSEGMNGNQPLSSKDLTSLDRISSYVVVATLTQSTLASKSHRSKRLDRIRHFNSRENAKYPRNESRDQVDEWAYRADSRPLGITKTAY